MRLNHFYKTTQRAVLLWALLLATLLAIAVLGAWFLQSTIPRHIVLASGPKDGMYHVYAQRHKEILARDGVTVEERRTSGAGDKKRLMLDPVSGVDVALMQGGVIRPEERGELVMLRRCTKSRCGSSTAVPKLFRIRATSNTRVSS